MEKARKDQFSFSNLDRYHVLCDLGDEEETNTLFDLYGERFVISGGNRLDADLYVIEEAEQAKTNLRPLLYFGTQNVPAHTYGINREDPDARQQFEQYLATITQSAQQRHELTHRTPFVAVASDDPVASARMLSDIISVNENLDCVGIVAYDHVTDEDEIRAVIFMADPDTMTNEDCIGYTREVAQGGMPVLAVLDGDHPQILSEILPRLWGWCDRNDLWDTQAKITELLELPEQVPENLYTVQLHLFGVGRPHNYQKGIRMLRRLAHQDHVEAMILLSDCYRVLMVDPPTPNEANLLLDRVTYLIQHDMQADSIEMLQYKEQINEDLAQRYLDAGNVSMARLIGTQSYTQVRKFYESMNEEDRDVLGMIAQSANRLAYICSHGEDFRTEVHMYCEYANLQRKLANAQWRQEYDGVLLDDLDMLINHGAQLELPDLVLEALAEAVAWQQLRFARTGAEQDRRRLARYLNLRGNFEMDAGNPGSAHETYATYTKLFSGDEFSDEREMREYAACLSQDADSLLHMNRKEEARREYRRANRVWRTIAENNLDIECLCGLCTTAEQYAVCVEGRSDSHVMHMMDRAIDYAAQAGSKAQTPVVWEALAKIYERKADASQDPEERVAYYRNAAEKWQDLFEMTSERYYRSAAVNAKKLAKKEAKEQKKQGGSRFGARKNRVKEEPKKEIPQESAVETAAEAPVEAAPARPFVAPLVGDDQSIRREHAKEEQTVSEEEAAQETEDVILQDAQQEAEIVPAEETEEEVFADGENASEENEALESEEEELSEETQEEAETSEPVEEEEAPSDNAQDGEPDPKAENEEELFEEPDENAADEPVQEETSYEKSDGDADDVPAQEETEDLQKEQDAE